MIKQYDLVVIGGGPAGIIAACFAAENGRSVALLEKNSELGKKILITGKGRCNITNDSLSIREFAEQFGKNKKFMLNLLYNFSVDDTISYFHKIGVETVSQRGGRVFPEKLDALFVREKLKAALIASGTEIIYDTTVQNITVENGVIRIDTSKGAFMPQNTLVATGALSYPGTGSTGDGYRFLQNLGINITERSPALTPLITKETWTAMVSNFNLKNVEVSLFADGKKIDSRFGEAFFTKNGIGGPIVLDMSGTAVEMINENRHVELQINMKPAVDEKEFEARVIKLFSENPKNSIDTILRKLMPQDMLKLFLQLHNITTTKCCEVSKIQRRIIMNFIYRLTLTVTGSEGYKRAIITKGGVSLKEINQKELSLKKYPNIFVAGEILDLDGPTGGFNMQVCWSSGYMVGSSI